MRAAVVFGIVAATLATPAIASADSTRTARIVSDGDCNLAGLDARSNELLGRTAIVRDADAQLGIYTTVAGDARISATLTFADASGVARSARTLEAVTCEEMVDSLAVVISLLLRDDATNAASPTPPAPAPAPVAVAPVLAVSTRETDVASRSPQTRAATRSLELAASMGTTRTAAIVVGGRLDRSGRAFGVELEVGIPSTTELGVGSVRVMTASLDAVACVRRGGLGACGFVMGGLVRGSGNDLMDARSVIRPVAGVGARLEWRQPMSRWGGIRMFVDVEQLVATTRFLVDEMPVWTTDARQASLGAGIYFHGP
jgi:hypothetical protein